MARAAKDAGRVLKLGGNHGFHGGAKAELGRCARADSSGGKPIIITQCTRTRARTHVLHMRTSACKDWSLTCSRRSATGPTATSPVGCIASPSSRP